MRRRYRLSAFTSAVLLLGLESAPTIAHGQAHASRQQLSEFAKRIGGQVGALAILSGDRVQTNAARDATADSLVAVVLSTEAQLASLTKAAAIATLLTASHGYNKKPYPGAAVRLILIAETSSDPGIIAGAVGAVAGLDDTSISIPFLKRMASSKSVGAAAALQELYFALGPAGQTAVHELSAANSVVEGRAMELLRWWEGQPSWKR